MPIQERFITTARGDMAWLEAGQGWPLLLLHAFPMNATMWRPQLERVPEGWRFIAPDFRGFGRTPPGSAPISIDAHAADVGALMDTLQIEEAIVGGLSMGGYTAFAILRHAARYVQGLILADTRAEADAPEGLEGRRKMLELVHAKGAAAVAEEMIPKLLGETTRRSRADVIDHVRSLVLSNSPEAIAGSVRALMSRPDSTPLLPTIHVPTLILVGAEDTVTPPPLSEKMHHAIAGSELTVIPGAGHLANLEQPDLFNAALARFINHRL